jgi:cellulose synthase operon protein C
VPPHIEPARIARYAQVTMKTQSGEGAQGLAWYAYNNCEFDTAMEWFQRAVAWFPKQDTVYGYAPPCSA